MGIAVQLVALAVIAVAVFAGAAAAEARGSNVTTLAFDEGYAPLFGDGNLIRAADGLAVRLLLNRYSVEGLAALMDGAINPVLGAQNQNDFLS